MIEGIPGTGGMAGRLVLGAVLAVLWGIGWLIWQLWQWLVSLAS